MIYRIDTLKLIAESGRRVLYDGSEVVDLSPKAVDLLVLLAEHAGELVSRDQIRAAIWPDQFVEDTNITRHVSLVRTCLRERLGDGEHLIRVPKRGYQLAAPVEKDDTVKLPHGSSGSTALATAAVRIGDSPVPSPPKPGRSMKQLWIAGAAAGVIALITAWGVHRWQRVQDRTTIPDPGVAGLQEPNPATFIPPTLHATPVNHTRPALAILDPTNIAPGKAWEWLGTAIREVLAMDFSATEDVKLVNGQNTIDAQVDLDLPRKVYDPALVRQIGKRMNADYAIVGTYRVVDSHIHVEFELLQTRDRVSLDSFSLDATEQTLIPELARAVSQFRARLNLPSAATPAGGVLPLEHGFAGLRPFAEGVRDQRLGLPAEAHPLLLRAAKLSPLSPMAHLELSRNSGKIGMPDLAASEAHFAIQRSNALPEETKLYVRARVHFYAAQYSECAEDYRRLVRLRPDDREYRLYLGECYFAGDQADMELELMTPYLALHDPRIDRQAARDSQRMRNWAKALEYADAQVQDAKAIYATAMTANGLVTRASAKAQLGDMPGAIADFQEAISIAERKQLLWELARAYERLGDAQSKMKNPAETLVNYKKMLEIWRRLGEKRNVLFSMQQVSFAQRTLHDFDGARKTLLEALDYADATSNEKVAAELSLNLAELSIDQKDLKAAITYAQVAYRKAMATGEPDIAGEAQGDMGDIDLDQGDIATARGSFLQGLDLAKQAKQEDLRVSMLKRLVKLETSAGNTDAAGKWQSEIAADHPQ